MSEHQPFDIAASIARFANEGIPVAVLARGLDAPSDVIRETIQAAIDCGKVTEMPRDDWPPTARRADHLPSQLAKEQDDHLLTACMRAFAVTKLQASFMLVLLKREEADKDTLHHVIESQRAIRRNQPDNPECTDPKMVDVVICNLRKRLRPYWVTGHETIKTLWGHGYYMEKADRDIALDKIRAVAQTDLHENQ
jgi:hypothetical protein